MENIDEFINTYKETLDELFEYEYTEDGISNFEFVCMFKDIFLKNYCYKSYTSSTNSNQIVHEWVNNKNDTIILSINDIRNYLRENIIDRLIDLSNQYIDNQHVVKMQFTPGCNPHILNDYKIKYIQKKQNSIKNGEVYKEFLDCYKNGYFN
jgi:hypothetical protein